MNVIFQAKRIKQLIIDLKYNILEYYSVNKSFLISWDHEKIFSLMEFFVKLASSKSLLEDIIEFIRDSGL